MEALGFGKLQQLLVLNGHTIHIVDPELLAMSEMSCYVGLILARYGNFHGFTSMFFQ